MSFSPAAWLEAFYYTPLALPYSFYPPHVFSISRRRKLIKSGGAAVGSGSGGNACGSSSGTVGSGGSSTSAGGSGSLSGSGAFWNGYPILPLGTDQTLVQSVTDLPRFLGASNTRLMGGLLLHMVRA